MAFAAAELHRLGDLLSAYHFHIPDYQRGYAWGKAQLQALWSDLSTAVRSDVQQHFTGIVLLRKLGVNGTTLPSVELVDGQQRVISAMTLARVLAQRAPQPKHPADARESLQYEVSFVDNEELQTYFDFWVLNDEREAARLGVDCSSYAANVEFATRFFRECADTLPDAQTAQLYLETLLDRFRLFVLDSDPSFDIHVAFETLNNRGKKLSKLELLKNRLMYLTNVLPAPSKDIEAADTTLTAELLRAQIHKAWKGIYKSLGRSADTQNHDDEFLRAHAIGYFGEMRDADWLENVLFNETFVASNASLSQTYIAQYIQNLEEAAVWWSHMHAPNLMPGAHQGQLNRFSRMGFAHFKPLVLGAYQRAATSTPAALGKPSEHEPLLKPVLPLLHQIERFIVLVFSLSGRPSHLGRADMNGMAHALSQPGQKNHPEAWKNAGIQHMDAADAIAFATSLVRAWISNEAPDGSRIDSRFDWAGEFSATAVAQTIADRMRLGQTGYYKWAFTKTLLLEYEEARRENGNKKIALEWPWDEFSFDKTVEHIYPQVLDDEGYWENIVRIDGRAKALRNAVTHSLGNLMLLSVKNNSTASRLPFRTKDGSRCKVDVYQGEATRRTRLSTSSRTGTSRPLRHVVSRCSSLRKSAGGLV